MPRKYRLKNPDAKGAKRPPEVLHAIRKLFSEGRTQSWATDAIERWARINGLLSVSRQTVNARYAEIGDKLFHLAYIEERGPRDELICDECRNIYVGYFRGYLYAPERFDEEKDWWIDRHWWRPTAEDKIKDYQREIVPDELKKASERTKGLRWHGTFYIQWAYAYWFTKFRDGKAEPPLRDIRRSMLEMILTPLVIPKGVNCHKVDYKGIEYRYYTNGVLCLRVAYGRSGMMKKKVPFKCEVIADDGTLRIDNRLMVLALFDEVGEWNRISAAEFQRALRQPFSSRDS